MRHGNLLLCTIFCCFVGVTTTGAQEAHQHDHQHDPAEKLGQVHFRTSCGATSQQQFTRALALLHSFQYVEAQQAFVEISMRDPQCAMAGWGAAMANYHPLWAPPTPAELKTGWAAVEKAKAANAKTPREREYIAAIETFYKDAGTLGHYQRAQKYAAAMDRIYRRYPRDREAAIFYALALNGTAPASDKNLANRQKAARILYRAWAHEPNHPGIAHYLIHSYDYPSLARLALPAARRYARVAPSSAHALHMPSHIFTRLGMWQDSIQSNIASAATAKQKVATTHPGAASQDQLHALDYLMYAYLQGAQDEKAKSILDEAQAYSTVDQVVFQAAFAWSAIPARFALERRRWPDAAALQLHPADFPWNQFRFAQANLHFARALGAAHNGDVASARQEIEQLVVIQKALGEVKGGYDWATQVEIQRLAAAAWLARAEGKSDEAVRLLRAAADLEDSTDKHPVTPGTILPAREMLGDLLLELRQPARALKEFEAVLQTAPNRFNTLYGAAQAAELAGSRQRARGYYTRLLALCSLADGARPELQKAKSYLANHN